MPTIPAMPAEAGGTAVVTVDLNALVANWRSLRERVAPATCAAVLKADAYGLGAGPVGHALADAGCRHFFVAHLDEAIRLRGHLPQASIASLGGLPPRTEEAFREHRIVPVLNDLSEIARWNSFSRRSKHPQPLPALIHLDTGMNRLGLGLDERATLLGAPERLAGLTVWAWISHLACADQVHHPLSNAQLGRFRLALAALPSAPASLANSSGIFRGPQYHFQLVRPGAALYGINPTPESTNPMRPVVRLDAPVLQVRTVDSPMTVGYGASHSVTRKGKIATLSIGYADGFQRVLGDGRARLWLGGRPVTVIGRVSMDLVSIDVSHLPEQAVAPGTLVEVIGPSRTVDQAAEEVGTIGYEILTSLAARLTRRYIEPEPRNPWTF